MSHELVSKLKHLANELGRTPIKHEFVMSGVSDYAVRNAGGFNKLLEMAGFEPYNGGNSRSEQAYKPKILVIDIETAPITAKIWSLWQDSVPLAMVESDWYVMCFAAKWVGDKKIFFQDQRAVKNIEDDKKLLAAIWKLMDEADIVVGQNSKSFDVKKLNARFLLNGFKPPSSFRQEDTKIMAKRSFGLTSNKLEYMSDKINVKYKKLKHSKFPGYELWKECLKKNIKALNEMKKYCIHDVLATEELYLKLVPWSGQINHNVFNEESLFNHCSSCGSSDFKDKGYRFTNTGKFQKSVCKVCGLERIHKENLLSKTKRQSLRE